jgi:peptide/nickel transport system substrate-binding protein
LHFGNIGDLQTLEGQTIGANGAYDHLYSIWDRLIATDPNTLEVQPMLAESWEIADNYQQLTFHLRRGVLFHSGRELTAADVKWSLLRIQDPKIGSVLTGRIAPMLGVDTPDNYTVVVHAARPWVEAFDLFEQATILDPSTFETYGLAKPTGTGPFMFAEYLQGDHLRLVKNPNYWQSDRPYLDEIYVSIHPDAQSAVVDLEAGGVDISTVGFPLPDLIRLKNDPNYTVLLNDHSGTSWIAYLNCTRPPTDNRLVRQAFNLAMDRTRMADTVWRGLQSPIELPWSAKAAAYDASKNSAVPFDLDSAQALLTQAGVSGAQVEIIYQAPVAELKTIAQIYQADLARIGITAVLKPLEAAAFLAARNNVDYQGIQLATHTLGHLKPTSNTLGVSYGPEHNLSGFQSDAYSALVNEVATESDPAQQQRLYAQLNDFYLNNAWALPIVPSPERAVARSRVRGMRFDAHQSLVVADVWLAQT